MNNSLKKNQKYQIDIRYYMRRVRFGKVSKTLRSKRTINIWEAREQYNEPKHLTAVFNSR